MGPLLTLEVSEALRAAARAGRPKIECTLDLGRSTTTVEVSVAGWRWQGQRFPHLESCKVRTIYYWVDETFQPVARYTTSLIKLVPTAFGPPTFEIDGIKMLPTARVSPYADAERKVDLIQPRGKVILDTCGGLGYFAGWCVQRHAKRVLSYEKNPDVIWLRSRLARPASFWHRGRTLLASLLRAPQQSAQAEWQVVSLHRYTKQTHQRARRTRRSG